MGSAKDEPDDVWWIGSDCGHLNDISPGSTCPPLVAGAKYRDISFVKDTITDLAKACAREVAQ